MAALAVFQNRKGPPPGLAGRGLVVSASLAVLCLACFAVHPARRAALRACLAVSMVIVAASAVLAWAQPTGPGFAGVFVGVVLIAVHLPWRAAVALTAAVFAVLAVVVQQTGIGLATGAAVMVAFGGWYAMMYLADRLDEAGQHAARLLAAADSSRAAQARAAGLAERQRLAREMHDVLAHSLSGLMLQLEGARMLAAGDPGDPRLPAAIERAHHLGRRGLTRPAGRSGCCATTNCPGPNAWPRWPRSSTADRGVPCQFTVSGQACELASRPGSRCTG